MKSVVIHAEAEAEVQSAIAYYEGRREGLGREFLQELEAAFDRIRRSPQTFASVDEHGTRKHRFHRFPYTDLLRRIGPGDLDCRGSPPPETASRILVRSKPRQRRLSVTSRAGWLATPAT